MIVVLSGEGPSDLGACNNAQGMCQIPEFVHGPMTVLVDKEIESRLHYSILSQTPLQYFYLPEARLRELEQDRKRNQRKVSLAGKKQAPETGYFTINAWILGEEALRLEQQENDTAIAVLFRDCDGTRSDSASLLADKWQSIRQGFARSELGVRGVPMLPKPKSEAWLLCAIEKNYQHCHVLEELSGNDDSPNSAKSRLRNTAALRGSATRNDLLNWLETHGFDHDSTARTMPSYHHFKESMSTALHTVQQLVP